jgi:hypothetical protein
MKQVRWEDNNNAYGQDATIQVDSAGVAPSRLPISNPALIPEPYGIIHTVRVRDQLITVYMSRDKDSHTCTSWVRTIAADLSMS